MATKCDLCVNYVFDDDYDGYICLANMDEDDFMRYITNKSAECPFFHLDDEYKIVRRQN